MYFFFGSPISSISLNNRKNLFIFSECLIKLTDSREHISEKWMLFNYKRDIKKSFGEIAKYCLADYSSKGDIDECSIKKEQNILCITFDK